MAQLTEKKQPIDTARFASRAVPVNQCNMTVPGNLCPIIEMTSLEDLLEWTESTLLPTSEHFDRISAKISRWRANSSA